ncbi:hypothetical protein CVT30_19515 [Streptomyces sp. AMCC400023]|nr:hypothetical protein CVT30_19515 [Streptomyces sp. AMCC400023]
MGVGRGSPWGPGGWGCAGGVGAGSGGAGSGARCRVWLPAGGVGSAAHTQGSAHGEGRSRRRSYLRSTALTAALPGAGT